MFGLFEGYNQRLTIASIIAPPKQTAIVDPLNSIVEGSETPFSDPSAVVQQWYTKGTKRGQKEPLGLAGRRAEQSKFHLFES